ncbi:MAG: hypothetical protein M3O28_08835 [Actinomycetota bacterium]|nr:hypothetical protein [Actinomycetota bacterium]
MTWEPVEFVDHGGDPIREPDRVDLRTHDWLGALLGRPAAILGWTLAGALALFAPFETEYSTSYTGADLPPQRADIDGWGRTTGVGVGQIFGHPARVGIALAVVAAAVLALVIAAVIDGRGAGRLDPALRVGSGVVVGLFVGVNALTWLLIDAAGSQVDAANRLAAGLGQNPGSADTASAMATLQLRLGVGPWLGTAAAVSAVAATLVFCRRDAPGRRRAQPWSSSSKRASGKVDEATEVLGPPAQK